MPGLLSNMFQADDSRGREGDGQHRQSAGDQHADGHAETHLDPTVNVHAETGGTYQNADGSTSQWEHSEDLTISANADAAADLSEDVTQGDSW